MANKIVIDHVMFFKKQTGSIRSKIYQFSCIGVTHGAEESKLYNLERSMKSENPNSAHFWLLLLHILCIFDDVWRGNSLALN